jgi:signal transduction histidine kinase/ActR/RegA family two-component response regulator
MRIKDRAALDRRVLVMARTSKDAATTERLLAQVGIEAETCQGLDQLARELRRGAAAMVIPEEGLSPAAMATLSGILAEQPAWSDLPVLVLTRPGADSVELSEALRMLGNVTVLECPLRVPTLLSAVRTAIRARDRQYQIRGHLAERARAEESLRQADQRKDEFLATLGHELRNPLAPVLTGLQLLKMSGRDDATAGRAIAVMERQIRHLIRLVDDLLEVSRITTGLIDVRREPLDLAFVVRAAVDTSRPAIETGRHELTLDLPLQPIAVSGDPVRLTQVFANILTNAAKYTNPGGRIHISARRSDGHAVVSVRDNGIGIPVDRLSAVFDMFTQVDRSSRRLQGGLGIGLTLVRSLVGMHGGRVFAKSDGPGTGSEFVVELPMLAGRADAVETAESMAGKVPPRRVLLVDDNVDAAETLGMLLTALGATISVAHSGRAALAALDTFDPDTVLLDIGMPEMDGYEVARTIRAQPRHADVLLIALTGWGQQDDQRRSRAAGFDHHLVKPPNIDKLRELLGSGGSRVERTL